MAQIKLISGIGLAAAALLLLAPAANAIEAAATAAVNVRSGPGVDDFAVVDTLYPGEIVDVVECNIPNTWCRIYHDGPDGWVSRSYLGPPPYAGSPDSSIQFGFTMPLPGGGSITFGTPGYSPPPDGGGGPAPAPETARVCVYELPDYGGSTICVDAGRSDANVGDVWGDRVSSLRVYGGASIRLCQDGSYGGICNVFNSDQSVLGAALNDQASSFDVLPPEPDRVCFYDQPNYQAGLSTCLAAGASDDSIGPGWNDRVSSLKVFGSAYVRLCQEPDFGGFCNVFQNNVALLGGPLNNNASSFETGIRPNVSASDARLKTGIVRLATLDNGIGLYEYSFIGETKRRVGVIAQEVVAAAPDAVFRDERGFYVVDYDTLFEDPVMASALQRSGYRLSP